ncbi:MAG: hypothetical protein KAR21_08135, partial [Spirochaetales bacterium]|nr:hypothetical protein [Spirochaetales bacterium]
MSRTTDKECNAQYDKERFRKMASEKSNMELIIRMITDIGTVSGLDNVIEHVLQCIMNIIGGTNIIMFCRQNDMFLYMDVFGEKKQLSFIEDSMIRDA